MRTTTFLIVVAGAATALAAQDVIHLTHHFKLDDKDTYKMHTAVSVPQGDVTVDVTLTQKVIKVDPDGGADMQTDPPDVHVNLNGTDITPTIPDKPVIVHLDASGMPTKLEGANGEQRFQFSKYANLVYNRDLKVGQVVPIDVDDKQLGHATGTVKLDEVSNGEAKLKTDLTVLMPKADEPMKIHFDADIDIASAKLDHMSGIVDNAVLEPGMPPVSDVHFTLDRVK